MSEDLFGGERPKPKLQVIVSKAVSAGPMSAEEVFDEGHEHLRVLTYSASIDFVTWATKRFRKADIVFGSEKVVARGFMQLIKATRSAEQRAAEYESDTANLGAEIVEFVRSDASLLERVRAGEVRFFVNLGHMSHDKLMIMTGGSVPSRVFQGSANMSVGGFLMNVESGSLFIDDNIALENAMSRFDKALEFCAPMSPRVFEQTTDETARAAVISDLFDGIGENGVVKFREVPVGTPMATMRILRAPEPVAPKGDGARRVKVTKDEIVVMAGSVRAATALLPARVPQPEDAGTICVQSLRGGREIILSGQHWSTAGATNVHPKVAAHAGRKLLSFLDNYARFPQADEDTPFDFWCAIVWFFSTPFLHAMRDRARAAGRHEWAYPNHFLMLGASNIGKTTFSEVAMRTLYGHSHIYPNMGKKAARQSIREQIGCFPYVMDEVKGTDLKNEAMFPDMVKSEQISDLAPTFSSTNGDARAVSDDVRKRAITIWLPFSPIPAEERRDHLAAEAKDVRGELFRYWHGRHAERIASLQDNIVGRGGDSTMPDLFQEVSSTLRDDLRQLCPDFSNKRWLRRVTASDLSLLALRPFFDEIVRWTSRNPDRVDLQRGPKGEEILIDSMWDKKSHDYFSTMSPQDAIIRSPTGAIIYDAAILRNRYGIVATRERTMMGMKKGVVTLKTIR